MVETIPSTPAYRTGLGRLSGAKPPASTQAGANPRTVRDVLDVAGGEKMVNLARGAELAAALPDATRDRAAFDVALREALEDIKRIMALFDGVLSLLRRGPFTPLDELHPPRRTET